MAATTVERPAAGRHQQQRDRWRWCFTEICGCGVPLDVLFGPLGMFYSTVSGALIMLAVSIVGALLTAGLSILLTWPACVIWGCVAASNSNSGGPAIYNGR
jgi:hypothetical protein